MSRFTKEHYEDVARIVRLERTYWAGLVDDAQAAVAESVLSRWTCSLVDLFAADNLPFCRTCGIFHSAFHASEGLHDYVGGFDREQFLAACGGA